MAQCPINMPLVINSVPINSQVSVIVIILRHRRCRRHHLPPPRRRHRRRWHHIQVPCKHGLDGPRNIIRFHNKDVIRHLAPSGSKTGSIVWVSKWSKMSKRCHPLRKAALASLVRAVEFYVKFVNFHSTQHGYNRLEPLMWDEHN